ncbi:MAG: PEP-CTERM sorting domain-containing protein [Kiritimatiellia bacterium]
MKKMMTLAACLLLAAVTHAAAVGWSIAGAGAFANGSYNVFVIGQNGVTSYEQITALLQSDGVEALSGYAWASGTVNSTGLASKTSATSGMSITYIEGGSEADNTYQAFAVIWDAEHENASYTDIRSTTLANNSTGKTFAFGNQSSNLAANMTPYGGAGGDIPEPTSGLLLLVGGAALALRRKQK